MKYILCLLAGFPAFSALPEDIPELPADYRELLVGHVLSDTDSCDNYIRIHTYADDTLAPPVTEIHNCRYYTTYQDLGFTLENSGPVVVKEKTIAMTGPWEGEISSYYLDFFATGNGKLNRFKSFHAECNDLFLLEGGYAMTCRYGCCADVNQLKLYDLQSDSLILEGDNRLFSIEGKEARYFLSFVWDYGKKIENHRSYLCDLAITANNRLIKKVGIFSNDSSFSDNFPSGDEFIFELKGLEAKKWEWQEEAGFRPYFSRNNGNSEAEILDGFEITLENLRSETGDGTPAIFKLEFKNGKINGKEGKEFDLFFPLETRKKKKK